MAAERPLVACLCAEWCGSCRDYQAVFAGLAAKLADAAAFVWVDIEDEAALVGELEVVDFPTLLVVDAGDDVRFFGAITPQPAVLARLVGEALADGAEASGEAAAVPADLVARLRQRVTRAAGDAPGGPARRDFPR